MKKNYLLLFAAVIFTIASLAACRKYGTVNAPAGKTPGEALTIETARHYYDSKFQKTTSLSTNLRHLRPDVYPMYPHWTKASSFSRGEYSYVEVPTAFTVKNNFVVKSPKSTTPGSGRALAPPAFSVQRLLIYSDKKGNTGEMIVNYVPDANYIAEKRGYASRNQLNQIDPDFDGFVVYSRTNNIPLFIARVEGGKFHHSRIFNTMKIPTARQAPQKSKELAAVECWEYCVEHWEQSCWAVPDPSAGGPMEECSDPIMVGETCTYDCFETFNELPDPENPASYEFPTDDGGMGLATYFPYFYQYVVLAPANPVVVQDFLKCFNKNMPAKFTIYADQPIAGSRTSLTDDGNGPNVGHAFVSIEQTVNGTTYSRTFGFYPSGEVDLMAPDFPSVFADDAGHTYDVKISTNVSANQLVGIIQNSSAASIRHYNLYQYNCTNFAIQMANIAGLNLSYTKGLFFPACNPGELGQDMRGKVGVNTTPGNAPAKSGNCN